MNSLLCSCRELLGKLLGKLLIINSRTLPLAALSGARVEGPRGVRSEVWWGSRGVVSIGRA
jgi:hypothetical protein